MFIEGALGLIAFVIIHARSSFDNSKDSVKLDNDGVGNFLSVDSPNLNLILIAHRSGKIQMMTKHRTQSVIRNEFYCSTIEKKKSFEISNRLMIARLSSSSCLELTKLKTF